MARRAVFLDLNGTLVLPVTVDRLAELKLIEGADTAIARLSFANFVCPVVTIQSRIAKGQFSLAEFQHWFQAFADSLSSRNAHVVGPYVCPHRFAEPCACKKPGTLLFEKAASDYELDLERSFVIGDTARDVEAATRFGGVGVLVRSGCGQSPEEVLRAQPYASYVAQSLVHAVDWILSPTCGSTPDTRRSPPMPPRRQVS